MARHETFSAVVQYLALWGLFFIGTIFSPLSFQFKVILESVLSISFLIAGGAYFYIDYRKDHPKSPEKLERPHTVRKLQKEEPIVQTKELFCLGIVLMFFTAVFGFLLMIFTWTSTFINGFEVVTYDNLHSLFYGISAFILFVYALYRIKNRARYIKPD